MTDAREGTTTTQRAVRFNGIGIRFDPAQEWVLRDLNLEIVPGQFMVLVGPSGCVKSTLLRLLAGFVEPTEGAVSTTSGPVTGPAPERGMVFQSVDTPLFEWLTARQNVEFGLRLQGRKGSDVRATADKFLGMVGLNRAAHKFPHELSGGMKQRVQIARVLAVNPEIILMDEPFAALDAQTRRFLQQEVVRIWQEERRTFLYVTHDIREAVLLGQKVAVMSAPPQSVIKHVYDIDLAYPRDEFDLSFSQYARQIEQDIEVEVKKQWAELGVIDTASTR